MTREGMIIVADHRLCRRVLTARLLLVLGDPTERLGEERAVAECTFLVDLRERLQTKQGRMPGLETLPVNLEREPPLRDLIEEPLDVAGPGELKLRQLRIGQLVLLACQLDLRL